MFVFLASERTSSFGSVSQLKWCCRSACAAPSISPCVQASLDKFRELKLSNFSFRHVSGEQVRRHTKSHGEDAMQVLQMDTPSRWPAEESDYAR